MNRRRVPGAISTSALALSLALAASFSPIAAESDPKAIEVAEATMEAMGGTEAFDRVRSLRFDFAFSRDGEELGRFAHHWDRSTGNYRVQGTDRETSAPFDIEWNLDSGEGVAKLDGVALTGDTLAERIEGAHARYINDTYWFLMPWKWLDPGVTLGYEGEQEIDGELCDVVTLSFDDGVGLTSNDRYWGFVSKKTGLLVRWEYVLQNEEGEPGDGAPTVWSWEDWQETEAGILVSKTKRRVGDGPAVAITFPVLELSTDAPDELLAGD